MHDLLSELREHFAGEIQTDVRTLERYSTDASMYKITPSAVLYPEDSHDIRQLVMFVNKHKALYPDLSITTRGAGTCMSGGPINDSIIIDMTRHFSSIAGIDGTILTVQPGVFMRDIDQFLESHDRTIGAAPASKALCTIGGMVANNSGGELSLQYGNIARSVTELTVILADGKEHVIKPLTQKALEQQLDSKGFLADLYKEMYHMTTHHAEAIQHMRPHVSKNSTGYNLWDVYNETTKKFDLTQIFCGSQGTLGIITSIKIKTVKKPQNRGMLLAYIQQPRQLESAIKIINQHHPLTFEGFDDITFRLGIKHFRQLRKQIGMKAWMREEAALAKAMLAFHGQHPRIILMVEFDGADPKETALRLLHLEQALPKRGIKTTIVDEVTSSSFWRIRSSSLTLLRTKTKDRYAAPFIDDLVIEPRFIPEFIPKLQKIIRRHKLLATITGSLGDGNFHIIPLLSATHGKESHKLEPLMREIIPLVQEYGGTLAGEHNDGLVRGPWLRAMYGDFAFELFRETKQLFDPMNIFNPHKKTDASWRSSMTFLRHEDEEDQLVVLKNT